MPALTTLNSAGNPWLSLPRRSPFVLDADRGAVLSFNETVCNRRDGRYVLNLDLYPEPYFGDPFAPIVLLLANPGVSESDFQVHRERWFERAVRQSLAHEDHDEPFLHLRAGQSTPGSIWWRRITNALTDVVGERAVTRGLLCLEYVPYHSSSFGSRGLSLPSQAYTFELLRAALRRGAYVVVMRARRLWLQSVPELASYSSSHVRVIKNPRNPALSPANLGSAFREVCEILERQGRPPVGAGLNV
jgi:hypothetical protein